MLQKGIKNFNCVLLFSFGLFLSSCRYDVYEAPVVSNYPDDVDAIITGKCATAGCHNDVSSVGAAGLDLSTWESLYKGTTNGAVVIPRRTDFSTLLYFTNTDSTKGLVVQPTMPINGTPLSDIEYQTLKSWIDAGGKSKSGEVMFPADVNRKKYYVTNQGCDVVSVFDAKKEVVMSMVDVGQNAGATPPESPHNIKVTPDGKYWVTVYLNSDIVQLYSTVSDELVKTIPIGNGIAGGWNTISVSKNSKFGYAVDYNGGRVAIVDFDNNSSQTIGPFPSTGAAINLHGSALNATDDTLYVTYQESSKLVKIPLADPSNYEDVNLNPIGPDFSATTLKPHEIIFSPDYTKYFVTCQDVNQVRVFDAATDQLIKVIPVGVYPLEFAMSADNNLLFVSNMEDVTFLPDVKGSVSVIDIINLQEIKKVKVGWQPHGIAVDKANNCVIVANRNFTGGPAPHHASACAGKNGSLSKIDMATLEKENSFKPELSVDPYSVAIKP
jgi:YVTN family beta-propeller protein